MTPDADISGAGASARTLVVTSREDLEMARQVTGVLGARTADGHPGGPTGV